MPIYLVTIAWLYVTLMMAVVEANNTDGSLLGALITFFLYGLLPLTLVLYIMRSRARRRARLAASARSASAAAPATNCHARGKPPEQ